MRSSCPIVMVLALLLGSCGDDPRNVFVVDGNGEILGLSVDGTNEAFFAEGDMIIRIDTATGELAPTEKTVRYHSTDCSGDVHVDGDPSREVLLLRSEGASLAGFYRYKFPANPIEINQLNEGSFFEQILAGGGAYHCRGLQSDASLYEVEVFDPGLDFPLALPLTVEVR